MLWKLAALIGALFLARATSQFTPVSLHPDDMVEGAGFPTGNLLVQKSRFVHYTYPTSGQRTFGLQWTLVADDGTVSEQIYSAGDINKWSPSQESAPGAGDAGRYALPMSGDTGLNKNTNAAFLMKELINAGFPEAQVKEGDAMRFDNLYALFEAKAQPTRTGGKIQQRENAQSAIPTLIHNLPWEPSKRGQIAAVAAPSAQVIAPTAAPVGTAPAPAPTTPVANNSAPVAAVAPPVAPVAAPVVAPAAPATPVPAVGAVPTAAPPGGPDVTTLQKVCLDAIKASVDKQNPTPHAMVAAQIMTAHAADPQVNAYANYLFTPEMHAYAATQGINTENGNYAK